MRTLREIAGILALVAMALLIQVEWSRLPAMIPTHFGMNGAPDGYGSRTTLWVVAGLAVVLYGLIGVSERFPHSFNLPVRRDDPRRPVYEAQAVDLLGWVRVEAVWLMYYIVWAMIRAALNDGPGVRWWSPVVFVAILGLTILVFMRRAAAETSR